MRVNVYAEEMTGRVEITAKRIGDTTFTGLRFPLELPVTVGSAEVRGPFMHRPRDDDSSAVTFWGKRDMRPLLRKALEQLDLYYASAAKADAASAARVIDPPIMPLPDSEKPREPWYPTVKVHYTFDEAKELFLRNGWTPPPASAQ